MIDVPLTKKQAELRILIDRMTRRYGYTPTIKRAVAEDRQELQPSTPADDRTGRARRG